MKIRFIMYIPVYFGFSFYSQTCFKQVCYLRKGCLRQVFAQYSLHIRSNFNNSNTDGSFTMAHSNSFLTPYESLPIT